MRDGGVEAKKGSVVLVPIDDIWAPPVGHPLWHPRAADPIDEELAADITKHAEVKKPIVVRDDGEVKGKRRLTLLDGARRTTNGKEAQRRLRASGALKKSTDNPKALFYVQVEFFKGSDAEFLLERLRRNKEDPLKKADRASVLAATVKQLSAPGIAAPLDAIVDAMPKGVGKREVESLMDWDNLVARCKERFDAGAPLVYLRNVLDAARDEQERTLSVLEESGAKTAATATRALRKTAPATTAPAYKMRPSKQVVAFREKLEEHTATYGDAKVSAVRFIAFLHGDDTALDAYPSVKQAAIDAGLVKAEE